MSAEREEAYMRRTVSQASRAAWPLILVLALALATLTPLPGRAEEWAPPEAVYFSETGHTLSGGFLDYWRDNGRAAFLGYPISERVKEEGVTVQYFEKARLELRGDTITLGALGTEMLGRLGIDLDERPRRARLLRGDEFDEPSMTPFTRLPSATFTVDPDDHRFFPESGHTLRYSFKLAWEKNGGLARYGLPLSEEFAEVSPLDGKVYTTQYFERARFEYHPETASNHSVVLTPLGKMVAAARAVNTAAVAQDDDTPEYDETLFSPPPSPTPTAVTAARPGGVPAGRKWIDVDLSRQYLTAYEGDRVFFSGYISSGKRSYETPTGTYSIFTKIRLQDMTGPDPAEPKGYYFQPDVPWVMYFADGGFAIHGVYWHNNFGTPMSHGCVGMPVGAAAALYDWAPLGTLVVIHY
jgi:lipoprotein-anchoring transpeptidase ErfK/SrfK